MRSVLRCGVAFGMIAATGFVSSATAQINPFLSSNARGLDADDMNMLFAATKRINDVSPARPGQVESWTNPESNASGTVTMMRKLTRSGMTCNSLQYSIKVIDRNKPGKYDAVWCHTLEGPWKIAG